MAEEKSSLPRRILRIPAEIAVGIFVVLDSVIGPLFGPFMRWLSSLRLIKRLEEAIASLPPYVILVLLVVPFGFAELAKVYAVVMMAEDHFRSGMTIFIGAYIVSILVCERTFHAGKGQLMKIGWFKILFDWVMAIKEHILGWFRDTAIWRFAGDLKEKARLAIQRAKSLFVADVGAKPKGSLERR